MVIYCYGGKEEIEVENKKIFNVSIVGCVLSFLSMIVIEYFPSGIVKCNLIAGHRGFFESIAIGIFTGTIATIVTSRIVYKKYMNDLAAKLSGHLMYMRFYLSHLRSKVDFTKVESEILLEYEIDFSLGFYNKIILECDELRENLELQIIFRKNMELYNKIIMETAILRQYCASISRNMRHAVDSKHKQTLLSGRDVKVESFLEQLKELLMELGRYEKLKGKQFQEYESTIDNFVVNDN